MEAYNAYTKYSYTEEDLKRILVRPEHSNKYTFGKVLFVCGSYGMAGAAYLSALAAYRTGAGLCEIFTPEANRIILQTLLPEAVVKTYTDNENDINMFAKLIAKSDAVVIGCGLGKNRTAFSLVRTVLKTSNVPTIVDADALNIISEHPSLKKYLRGRIITPHFAEASRLKCTDIWKISENPKKICAELAQELGCVCVLKDHNTLVSDGNNKLYVNKSGNSGMAKAGSGDLLAGVIGALAARRDAPLSNLDAAALGVYIHGLAGDISAEQLGKFSILATDIANAIPNVMKNI